MEQKDLWGVGEGGGGWGGCVLEGQGAAEYHLNALKFELVLHEGLHVM